MKNQRKSSAKSLIAQGFKAGLRGETCEAPATRGLQRGAWEEGWRAGTRIHIRVCLNKREQ